MISSKVTSFKNDLCHFLLYIGHTQQHYKVLNAFSLNPQETQLMAAQQLMVQNSLSLFFSTLKPVKSVCSVGSQLLETCSALKFCCLLLQTFYINIRQYRENQKTVKFPLEYFSNGGTTACT